MLSIVVGCAVLGFAVMLFGLASLRSDLQIIIALIGFFSCAILSGLAWLIMLVDRREPPTN